MRLNQSLRVNGTMQKATVTLDSSVQDYVVVDQFGQEFCSITLPIHDEVPVEYINIVYNGRSLEVMGHANNRPVFLMVLSDTAMKQITTKWLTKL